MRKSGAGLGALVSPRGHSHWLGTLKGMERYRQTCRGEGAPGQEEGPGGHGGNFFLG